METAQMCEIIRSAQPGDKLELVFADKTFDGDLKGRLYMILAMHGHLIQFLGMLSAFNLQAVADSGRWEGWRTYVITVLDGFDPDYFINRTIGREMLESVSRELILPSAPSQQEQPDRKLRVTRRPRRSSSSLQSSRRTSLLYRIVTSAANPRSQAIDCLGLRRDSGSLPTDESNQYFTRSL